MPLFNFRKRNFNKKYSGSSDIITEKAIYKSRPVYQDSLYEASESVKAEADDKTLDTKVPMPDNNSAEDIKKYSCDEDGGSEVDYDNVRVELHPLLERFLDANSYEDKLNVFYLMKNVNDEKLLSDVAMSLDIQISKETVEEQYQEILYCLKTMEKFECNRMRR